jgi:hypothetical protein
MSESHSQLLMFIEPSERIMRGSNPSMRYQRRVTVASDGRTSWVSFCFTSPWPKIAASSSGPLEVARAPEVWRP